jgi:hypothetical protein
MKLTNRMHGRAQHGQVSFGLGRPQIVVSLGVLSQSRCCLHGPAKDISLAGPTRTREPEEGCRGEVCETVREEQEELSYWRRSAAQRLLSVTDYLAENVLLRRLEAEYRAVRPGGPVACGTIQSSSQFASQSVSCFRTAERAREPTEAELAGGRRPVGHLQGKRANSAHHSESGRSCGEISVRTRTSSTIRLGGAH